MTTRADFLAHCAAHSIEVEDDERSGRHPRTGEIVHRHIHAYAPAGKRFAATETHNIGLGDYGPGEKPKWSELIAEATLEDCPGAAECEYCSEEQHLQEHPECFATACPHVLPHEQPRPHA